MADRMKRVNDRMMENLKKAYEIGKDDEDVDELSMLTALDKADKLRKNTAKLFKKIKK